MCIKPYENRILCTNYGKFKVYFVENEVLIFMWGQENSFIKFAYCVSSIWNL